MNSFEFYFHDLTLFRNAMNRGVSVLCRNAKSSRVAGLLAWQSKRQSMMRFHKRHGS
jgi:hypothetical protein